MSNAVMTAGSVEALKLEMDRAFEAFSDRHAETEAAKTKLQTVAQGLAALNARRRALMRAKENLLETFTQALAKDPAVKIDGSKVAVMREEAAILDAAMTHLRIGAHAAAECAHLAALVLETESQLAFETLRLSHHEMQVAVLLAGAAELDGRLELASPGAVTEQLQEIVADLNDKLGRAREALRAFDKQIADARVQHESSLREKTI